MAVFNIFCMCFDDSKRALLMTLQTKCEVLLQCEKVNLQFAICNILEKSVGNMLKILLYVLDNE